jgi:hypothetical protein
MVMVIKNRKTGELIRLVPSEKQLKIKNQMAVSTGLLFDQIPEFPNHCNETGGVTPNLV